MSGGGARTWGCIEVRPHGRADAWTQEAHGHAPTSCPEGARATFDRRLEAVAHGAECRLLHRLLPRTCVGRWRRGGMGVSAMRGCLETRGQTWMCGCDWQCAGAWMSTTVNNRQQPSTTVNNRQQPSTTVNNRRQPSTSLNNPQQPSTTVNNRQQPSTTVNNRQ